MDWMVDSSTVKYLLRITLAGESVLYATALFTVFMITLWWFTSPNKNAPPGPRGLPLVGYLPWIDPKAPHMSLSKLVARYGKIFRLDMGGVSVVVMADHNVIKETLNLKCTSGRAPLYLTHGIMKGYGLICSEGFLWRDHRKFVAGFMRDQGMRAASARADMEQRIQTVAKNLAEELSKNREAVDISAKLLHHVGNTMNQLIFGLTYDENDPTWVWLRHLLEEGTKLVGVAGPMNFLPWLRFLPKYQKVIRFLTENQMKTHQEYQKIIDVKEDSLRKLLIFENSRKSTETLDHITEFSKMEKKRTQMNQIKETNATEAFGNEDKDPYDTRNERKIEPNTDQNCSSGVETICQGRNPAKQDFTASIFQVPDDTEKGLTQGDQCNDKIHSGKLDSNPIQNGLQMEETDLETGNIYKHYNPQNIIEAYIKERSERGEDVGNFTYEQLHHVAADLFGAGTETTITTLKWHLLNMALYLEVQTKVQEELDECAKGSDHVSLDESNCFPFTMASIMETQRLRNTIPLGIPHGASEDLTISGYNIPAGTMLLPLLWFVHHDPNVWENPDQYLPQRFIKDDGQVNRQHPAFMPFQTGRRMCLGDEFAKMILYILTTTLLLRFRVSLDNEGQTTDPAQDPICGISLCPRPFKLIFTERFRR